MFDCVPPGLQGIRCGGLFLTDKRPGPRVERGRYFFWHPGARERILHGLVCFRGIPWKAMDNWRLLCHEFGLAFCRPGAILYREAERCREKLFLALYSAGQASPVLLRSAACRKLHATRRAVMSTTRSIAPWPVAAVRQAGRPQRLRTRPARGPGETHTPFACWPIA